MKRRLAILTFLGLLTASPAIAGGAAIKASLRPANAGQAATGTLTLDGYNLSGHLSGAGVDVAVSGTVKSSGVSVVVTGRISPSCNLNSQSMSGDGPNNGANTSITLDFFCTTKAGNWGGGEDYLYHLDLEVPAHHLQMPGETDPGESA
jgi:hypothetical protein